MDIKGKVVHHKDGNPFNNTEENLQTMTMAEHTCLHCVGREHSTEARRKMSKARKGKKFSVAHRAKIGEANKRRIMTDEQKRKLLEGHVRPETLAKIKQSLTGKKRTPEQRQAMSQYVKESHRKRGHRIS